VKLHMTSLSVALLFSLVPAVASGTPSGADVAHYEGGFYVGGGLGAAYVLINDLAEPDPYQPSISGSQGYGPGAGTRLAIGYDVAGVVAVELVGGAHVALSSRTDRVRSLALSQLGLGVRFELGVAPRWRMSVGAAGLWAQVDDAVAVGSWGLAGEGSIEVEYAAVLRHFVVGLSCSFIMPLNPVRLLVSVGPTIKYVF